MQQEPGGVIAAFMTAGWSCTVDRVAGNGMPDVIEMDANLVRAPRARVKGNQRMPRRAFDDFEFGLRLAAVVAADRHLFPVSGAAPDGEVDGQVVGAQSAVADGKIAFMDRAVGELFDQ